MTEHERTSARVALVTGAGSDEGIGFACASRLAAGGADLIVTSTTDRIRQRASELEAFGSAALGIPADLTDPAAAERLVRAVLERFGRLDVLVNNAGMTSTSDPDRPGGIVDLDRAQWQASVARNLDTVFSMTQAALVPMLEAGHGRIVNISSVSGPVLAYPGDVAYHAAKAGIVGLTRAVAVEVAGRGVTVNAVAPGWIATGSSTTRELQMGCATPVGRPGTPDEVASVVGYLASVDASYLTGQTIVIDGGNSIQEERGIINP